MKKFAISAIAFAGIFFAVTLVRNLPVRAHDEGQDREDRKFESEIKIGFDGSQIQALITIVCATGTDNGGRSHIGLDRHSIQTYGPIKRLNYGN